MTTEGQAPADVHAILLVEDDNDIGDFIIQALGDELPHQVLSVSNASHALEVVQTIKPVLFILDYQLPGIDGLELSRQLHALDGLETVPTLLISANPPPREAMHQPYLSSLAKPFDLADFLQAVKRLLPEQEV
jgi:DNA-binding NtrC family response regulator